MFVSNSELHTEEKQATGRFVTISGEKYYLIENYDAMQPFFISLASDTDLWMYLSSTGGLTCGRQSPDKALFPYYTDDKITESYTHTGPHTIIRVTRDERTMLWEPFSDACLGLYNIQRNILKSVTGNRLIFEEINHDLGVRFSYMWTSADKFGWIRRATIENIASSAVEVEWLDGIQNLLPSGTNRVTQNMYSTLVDGYKKTELVEPSLALLEMEAIMVDRAEPSESLRCNTIYCLGLPGAEYHTSNRCLAPFRQGRQLTAELVSKGVRCAFFVHSRVALMAGAKKMWYMVADVDQDAVSVRALQHRIQEPTLIDELEAAVQQSTDTLRAIVAQNDGIQLSADEHINARHFANVLFNTMRGGFYCNGYMINTRAFMKHVDLFNHALYASVREMLAALPETISRENLQLSILHSPFKKSRNSCVFSTSIYR